jgi:hypothetical protein
MGFASYIAERTETNDPNMVFFEGCDFENGIARSRGKMEGYDCGNPDVPMTKSQAPMTNGRKTKGVGTLIFTN